MWQMRNAHNTLVGNPKGKRLLGRPRRRWKDNIKMDIMEMGMESVDWIHLTRGRDRWRALVNTVTNLQFYKRQTISSLAERTLLKDSTPWS
jgi:hypothetical protein